MRGRSRVLRGISVVAVALAPLSALEADAAVQSGDANASGPGLAFENTGGNIEIGKGRSESRVILGDPNAAPAPPAVSGAPAARMAPSAKPVDPTAAKLAKARALVDAARAKAQAQIDAARRQAEEAVERAHQQADEARSRSHAQSDAARAQADDDADDADDSSASNTASAED